MFRPNRIGTPLIHQQLLTDTAVVWTPNSQLYNLPGVTGNVINANPVADFGFSAVSSSVASNNLPDGHMVAIVQQFTVTQPLAGDAVGLELSAAIFMNQANFWCRPVFFKTDGAAGAVFGNVDSDSRAPMPLGPASILNTYFTSGYYKEQLVHQESNDTIEGIYAHGFIIINKTGAAAPITYLKMQAAVRQLNDQQDIRYRDTLR